MLMHNALGGALLISSLVLAALLLYFWNRVIRQYEATQASNTRVIGAQVDVIHRLLTANDELMNENDYLRMKYAQAILGAELISEEEAEAIRLKYSTESTES